MMTGDDIDVRVVSDRVERLTTDVSDVKSEIKRIDGVVDELKTKQNNTEMSLMYTRESVTNIQSGMENIEKDMRRNMEDVQKKIADSHEATQKSQMEQLGQYKKIVIGVGVLVGTTAIKAVLEFLGLGAG